MVKEPDIVNDRLVQLVRKVKDKTATRAETDEFMKYMYDNGKIARWQYDDYQKNRRNQKIINAALAGAGLLLLIHLLNNALEK
jgi:hypothetical protein